MTLDIHVEVIHIRPMTPLHVFMLAEKMTDRSLAKAVGRDRSTITKIRLGQAAPSLDLALKIQRISKGAVTASDFLSHNEAAA